MKGRDPSKRAWHESIDPSVGFVLDDDNVSAVERAQAHATAAEQILANLTPVQRNHGHAAEAAAHATLAVFYRDVARQS
jgi:hypothetical protein